MKKFLFSIIAILFSIACYSQTPVPPGPISGTWDTVGSPYLIQGETTIEDGTTLTIEEGVEVRWQNDSSSMFVQGQIVAEGTVTDSIVFTAEDPLTGWKGIRFWDTPATNDTSRFAYCTFKFARAHGPYPDNCGGAIAARNFGKIIFDHCYFHHNEAMEYDPLGNGSGAIGLWTSSPRITNCLFKNNSALLGGAIICYMSSSPLIRNNVFTNNFAKSFGAYGTGYAAGIGIITNSHPDIINNTFHANHAETGGGAIFVIYNCDPTIDHNLIFNNTAGWMGGGIEVQDTGSLSCSPIIINNTIAHNYAAEGGGIDVYGDGKPQIRNTILWGNKATNIGNQVNIMDSDSVKFYYCDIEDGLAGIGGHAPAVYDTCIKSDPMFVDHLTGDYHLMPGSPCIDAGDPTSPPDPDGTISDMGALFFDQTGIGISDIRYQKSEFSIECWPNPTYGISDIRYSISDIRNVLIAVYDITGKQLIILADETQNAGEHVISIDISELPDGLYIVRLQAGEESAVGKVLVVR